MYARIIADRRHAGALGGRDGRRNCLTVHLLPKAGLIVKKLGFF
jgi:hypothetical protein